jgi:hypothetical protein
MLAYITHLAITKSGKPRKCHTNYNLLRKGCILSIYDESSFRLFNNPK